MKKYLTLIAALALSVSCLTSCDDEFLNCYPSTSFNEANVFNSYNLSEAYLRNLYEVFLLGGYEATKVHDSYFCFPGINTQSLTEAKVSEDTYTGTILDTYSYRIGNEGGGIWSSGRFGINTQSADFTEPYMYIRIANIALNNLDRLKEGGATAEQVAHIEAVARFFRAYCHWSLLYNFGDAIYVDKTISDNDEEALRPAKTPRTKLADNIYKEFEWCINNIPDKLCKPNTINSDVVKFAMARFCLFEGTYRKYHNVPEPNEAGIVTQSQLLTKAQELSKYFVDNFPLYQGSGKDGIAGEGFSSRFASEDLSGVKEVILYDKRISNHGGTGHGTQINGFGDFELPQWMVDLFPTKDGLPIHNAGVKYYDWNGTAYVQGAEYDYANCDPYKTFRNRDPRLAQIVVPPYSVEVVNNYEYKLSTNAKYNEYLNQFPKLGSLNNGNYIIPKGYSLGALKNAKALPLFQAGNRIIGCFPNLEVGVQSQGAFDGKTQYWSADQVFYSRTGYSVWMQFDYTACSTTGESNPNDVPIFMADEMYLTYAEASYELSGKLEGNALKAINDVRSRAGVGALPTNIAAGFDPDCPEGVAPTLWEIRRERLIETCAQGLSRMDAVRWGMGPWFAGKTAVGVWVDADNLDKIEKTKCCSSITGLTLNNGKSEATADAVGAAGGGHIYLLKAMANNPWNDKAYLKPIPTFEIELNPNLTQNPGY